MANSTSLLHKRARARRQLTCISEHTASALWVAAGAGHLTIVKALISRGADVNQTTLTRSTPLRAACYEGRIDIVQYLVDHGADIHTTNKFRNSCLMIACYKGHHKIVKYLLEKGLNPNLQAFCGGTALHFAAEFGHLEIVKELLKYATQHLPNKYNLSPLMCAADNSQAEVVEYFLDRKNGINASRKDHISALELLGASYANCKDNLNLQKTYHYLYWALILRHLHSDSVIAKDVSNQSEAYEGQRESQNIQQLNEKKDDPFKLQIEALLVRERILGYKNPTCSTPSCTRERFVRTICSLGDASPCGSMPCIYDKNKDGLYKVTCLGLLRAGVKEVHNSQSKADSLDEDEMVTFELTYHKSILTMLYLMCIIIHKNIQKTDDEEIMYKKLAYQFLAMKPVLSNGSSPLHLAADQNTPVDDFHTNDVCSFPHMALVQLLLECGADPNATDIDGNSPLHVICKHGKPISDFMTLHAIIYNLIKAGCHVDRVNHSGDTAENAASTGVAEVLLKTMTPINLKCLSARIVQKFALPYKGSVPKSLEEFIDMH
ncbi:hypothetical protein BSL78_08786 [Apostichopus japonicus]|uniref:Protein fem-1 homolog B n=1 Tax=Stichopus japonicus TaxID=307972 RepID=A0A2G8L228_STIJA|nr:hypothetical protein BSL78_08786 [Apostichopus japonicus]